MPPCGGIFYYLCNYSIEEKSPWQSYLNFALITSEQMYNAFVIVVKTMINNMLFLINWARESITFCHIHAYSETLTTTFKWSKRTTQFLSSQKWKYRTKKIWKKRNTISNICHQNIALRLLFCVPNVVYLYDLQMSIVKHFHGN